MAIEEELATSTPRGGAVKILKNLDQWLKGKDEVPYLQLTKEVQRLRTAAKGHFRRGDPTTGITLNDAANKIINTLDDVSPALKLANTAYRRQQSISELTTELRKANTSVAVRETFKDPLIQGAFTSTEIEEIIRIADTIGRIASGSTVGAGNRFIMAVAEPLADILASNPWRILLEKAIARPNMTASQIASLIAQLGNQIRREEALAGGTEKDKMAAKKHIMKDSNVNITEKVQAVLR